MQRINNILIILVLLFTISCDDILEEDISDDLVQITSPINNITLIGNTVNFTWQPLNGADSYRIQISELSQNIILDSLVSTSNFSYVMNSGSYQWRIKAENFSYQTDYTFPANFSLETSQNLDNQTVVLQTPSQNLYSNSNDFVFTWDELEAATSYDIDLLKNTTGLETVFQLSNITDNGVSVAASYFTDDAEYIWKIRGVNAMSQTDYSERSLYIDRQSPNQPNLVSPAELETTSTETVTFNWLNGTDTGTLQSEITNTFEIATDINFNAILYTEQTSNNTSQYEFTTTGTYYWRVKAVDLAFNQSDFSIVRTLVIQ
ncbi:hypothetical protein [Olleya sp. HaHaR_3_96]|uniref:hypothetical protein n=1 Tax=Olleya sp. HaHaR_3_96 TaxID=2745560 RepID=UPI001C4F9DA7|nr:hypothetical protein [Olleya sp. HaHaR_3_96]QXP58406.1 hypothetical protein H0I26_10790 [Olleya sp. HaHaR_3_96]